MKIFKYIYYIFYDLLILIRNLKGDKNFIILFPRFISLIFKFTVIYDKKNKVFFNQHVRNEYDIITVNEIFAEESYNLTKLLLWSKINKKFKKLSNENKIPLLLDCGSNISSSTEYFCRIFKGIFPIMVEPNIESSSFGRKNLNIADYLQIDLPLSSEKKVVRFDNSNKDNRAAKISTTIGTETNTILINDILNDHKNKTPFIIKIDIEGYEEDLMKKNLEWLESFEIIIIEIHDWMIPGKAVSFNLFNAVNNLNKKRDVIISGENIFFIKIHD